MSEIKRYQHIGRLIEHSEAIFRLYPMSTVYVRADDHDAALTAKDARIAELEQKIIGLEDAFASNLDYRAMYRQLRAQLASQQQAEPKGCTKPDCFPYFDCGTIDDYVPPATHSEDGGEVVGYRVPVSGVYQFFRTEAEAQSERDEYESTLGPEDIDSVVEPEPLMTVAQHERIVAAKDAEIARLKADDAEAIKRPPYAHICIGMPAALHHDTRKLLERFTHALAVKLRAAEEKYGYSNGWKDAGWMDECRAKLAEHMAKGDPRDVAAYCAFLWHHGESTAQPARQVGGDEPMAEVGSDGVFFLRKQPDGSPWPRGTKLYAALAPAAVVMPERRTDANYPTQLWREAAGWNAALDEVARLNRRAIPVELLERCAERLEYHMCSECKEATCCMPGTRAAAVELRALLGKEEGGQ